MNAAALAVVFAYRVLSLWLPLPVSLGFMPVLRAMAENRVRRARGRARPAAAGDRR